MKNYNKQILISDKETDEIKNMHEQIKKSKEDFLLNRINKNFIKNDNINDTLLFDILREIEGLSKNEMKNLGEKLKKFDNIEQLPSKIKKYVGNEKNVDLFRKYIDKYVLGKTTQKTKKKGAYDIYRTGAELDSDNKNDEFEYYRRLMDKMSKLEGQSENLEDKNDNLKDQISKLEAKNKQKNRLIIRDPNLKILQNALGVSADGVLGPNTWNAIEKSGVLNAMIRQLKSPKLDDQKLKSIKQKAKVANNN